MSFERVSVIAKPTSADDTGVRVSLVKTKTATAKLRITVDAERESVFFDRYGQTGHFVLLVGRQEDHGMLRLQPSAEGDLVAATRTFGQGERARHVMCFNCGHLPHLVDRAEKPQPVQWEWVDDAIEIVLPKWADETRPKPPSADEIIREQNRIAAERRQRLGVK